MPNFCGVRIGDKRILVLDTLSETSNEILDWLRRCDYRVQHCVSLLQGFQACRRGECDIVITNLALDEQQLFYRYRCQHSIDVPVIVLVPNDDEVQNADVRLAGVSAVFPKPVTFSRLVTAIQSIDFQIRDRHLRQQYSLQRKQTRWQLTRRAREVRRWSRQPGTRLGLGIIAVVSAFAVLMAMSYKFIVTLL